MASFFDVKLIFQIWKPNGVIPLTEQCISHLLTTVSAAGCFQQN